MEGNTAGGAGETNTAVLTTGVATPKNAEAQTPGSNHVPTDAERYRDRLADLEPQLHSQVEELDLSKCYAAGDDLIKEWFERHFPEIGLPALLERMGIRGADVVAQLNNDVRRRVAVAMANPDIAALVGDHAEVAMGSLETRYSKEVVSLLRKVIELRFMLAANVAFESHDMALALRELPILRTFSAPSGGGHPKA